MIRTSVKIIASLAVALAVALPAAAGSSRPTTPRVGEGYSLGVPPQYLKQSRPARVGEGFSLGVPQGYLKQSRPTRVSEGFSLGVPQGYLAKATPPASGEGFDWGAALVGGGIVAGLFLFVIGAVAALRVRPRGRAATAA